jgi:hypothetical protein
MIKYDEITLSCVCMYVCVRVLIVHAKEKKKEWLNEKIKQIEEANRRSETQKLYKDSAFL